MTGLTGLLKQSRAAVRARISATPAEIVLVATLVALAFAVRFAGRRYLTTDMVYFFEWYNALRDGGIGALRLEIGNYNAPVLYLFLLATTLPFSALINIKIVFALFDLLLIFYTYRLVGLKFAGWRIPFAAACVVALLPTVVSNASIYGQCDSIYASFAVGGVYYLIRNRPWWACVFFGLSLAFKPQAVFMFPLVMVLVVAGRLSWRAALAIPLTYVVLDIPAVIVGADPERLLFLYTSQMGADPALTRNAPNIYQFMPVTEGIDLVRELGTLFTAAMVIAICYLIVAGRLRLTAERIVLVATLYAILVPFVTPGMHERYFYIADVLTVVAAFYLPRLWYVPVLVQLASFLSYLPFLFWAGRPHPPGTPEFEPSARLVDLRILTVLMAAALVAVGYHLARGIAHDRATVPRDKPEDAGPPEERVAAHRFGADDGSEQHGVRRDPLGPGSLG